MSIKQQVGIEILKRFSQGAEELIENYGLVKIKRAIHHTHNTKDQFKKNVMRLKCDIDNALKTDNQNRIQCTPFIIRLHDILKQYQQLRNYPRSQARCCLQCYDAFFYKKSFLKNFQRHLAPTLSTIIFFITHIAEIPQQHVLHVLCFLCNKDMERKSYRHQVLHKTHLDKDFQQIEDKIHDRRLITLVTSYLNIEVPLTPQQQQKEAEDFKRLFNELDNITLECEPLDRDYTQPLVNYK